MRWLSIAALPLIIVALLASSASAATIKLGSFERDSRSVWAETIEAENPAVTICCGSDARTFNVSPPAPWNSGVWLTARGAYAEANFSTPATELVVQFEADDNDGPAQFIVDGVPVGIYQTNNKGWIKVVISGLTNAAHTIRVVSVGAGPNHGLAIESFGAIATDDLATLRGNSFRIRVVRVKNLIAAGLGGVSMDVELSQYADGMWTAGKTLHFNGAGIKRGVPFYQDWSAGYLGQGDWVEFETDNLYRIDDFRNIVGYVTFLPGLTVVMGVSGGMTLAFEPPGHEGHPMTVWVGAGNGLSITIGASFTGTWN